MRKGLLCVLMMGLLFLPACSGAGSVSPEEELALTIRGEYLAMTKCTAQLSVTADYGQRVYEFELDAAVNGEETVLTVTAPELIAGVTARTAGKEGALEYDGVILETGALSRGGLSPMSAFPALLLVLNSLRYTALTVADLTAVLENVLPEALMDSVQELISSTYRSASSAVAGVSVLTLLWSSSKGVYGLLKGLNAVYGVEEDRGYVYTRGISVVYALLFLVVLVLTLVLHVFGNTLTNLLHGIENPVVMFLVDLIDLRSVLLLAVQVLMFTAIYMVLPNRRNGFWESLPGAVFSSVGWAVFSWAYSVYVTHFSKISNI